MRNKLKKLLVIIFVILLLPITTLVSCNTSNNDIKITKAEQLNNSNIHIGIASDTSEDVLVSQNFPNAKIEYFKDEMSGFVSVAQGKIDAFVFDKLQLETAIYNGLKGVKILDETVGEPHIGAVAISPVTKIENLKDKINEFLEIVNSNGISEDMWFRWLVKKDETMPDIPIPEESDINLVVGTTGISTPFTYYKGTELCGYEIELANRFASWLGATITFKTYDYEGIVAAALTGDVDCIFANLYVTPEREEVIEFSNPTYRGDIGILVRDYENATNEKTLDDLESAKIGITSGSNHLEFVGNRLPNAQIMYFNTDADLISALITKKVDAIALDEPTGRVLQNEYDSITLLDEILETLDYAFVFDKTDTGEALQSDFDIYLAQLINDGTIEKLQEKWFDSKDLSKVEMFDYTKLPNTNGTIKLATHINTPFSFLQGDLFVGFEIEILAMYCQNRGYALELNISDFEAVFPAIKSGRCDVACGGITKTEERKETVLFSLPTYAGGTALLVLKNDSEQTKTNIFQTIGESFEKTFIRENRWLLFLQGIGTTMLITILSIIFGTLLGFIAFMLCRKGNKVANIIAKVCVWIIQGMPIVVLLMILYYVIFGGVSISGTFVSIIGFTLIFGSAVFNMLKSGIDTIDKGQMEASYALGYSNRKAFFRVILPQVIPHIIPQYKGEITALIKATAIVGYVAVQDLTKMGDIVRGRTFEPFFPLIAVAIIYYLLAAILTFIINKIEIQINPKKRVNKKLLKGVKR